MGRFSVIQLSLLVSSHCMSIATHHIRIASDSILPKKKYSPKIYMAMEKPTIWRCMFLLKNDDFPAACHVRLTWRVMPAFHVSSPTQKQVVLKPLTYKKKTHSLALSLPKKKKVFFLASLKGQVRECLQIPVLVLKDMFLFSSEGITISEYDLFIFEPKKHT